MAPYQHRVTSAVSVAAPAMKRPRRTLSLLATLLCASALGVAPLAHADPGDLGGAPSQEQVAEAKAKVALTSRNVADINAALDAATANLQERSRKAGIAAEKANAAKIELDQRVQAAEEAQKQADRAAEEAGVAKRHVDSLAAQVWMNGGSLDGLEVLIDPKGTTKVADRAAGLDVLSSYRNTVLGDANKASERAATASRAAATAKIQQEAAARQAKDTADAARAELRDAVTERNRIVERQKALLAILAEVRRTSTEIEEQRRTALLEAAAREAAARAADENPIDGSVPAVNGSGAAAAIAYARAQLGKPYHWGGEGPVGYDCSGLTKMAWASAGVSLIHQTNNQWAQTKHVPLNQAQPGDLIFYGQIGGDIHHVGLYIGGGRMIAAPTFNEPIQIQSIYWGDLVPYAGRVI
ncbi:hypothetical protein KEM60_01029 [Austwickia sp. TVS 96-490-7B]|uniref:C40 family peptidase n=1 Tax=Austwickia sp. TVS 96-490-7B TaxID=2830843 RepID=UPI001C5821A1|nr:C40 family peptidase [Austwickia sp. TVS 96-490-7B]MBW3084840.1 hypothetical protein [Austwickia sp. TVS 96-490-7B]